MVHYFVYIETLLCDNRRVVVRIAHRQLDGSEFVQVDIKPAFKVTPVFNMYILGIILIDLLPGQIVTDDIH